MPAAYAHYRFGKEVLSCLPNIYSKSIQNYRELYDIGLHGPDILFYYKPLSSNPINKLGNSMHDKSASIFFSKMVDIYRETSNTEALEAYLYGFICHFALDSTCHPYVEKMVQTSKLSHTEIETELERFFMLKDNINPMAYVPIQHIFPNKFNSHVIAPCFDLSDQEICSSLKGMITSHKLLHAPGSLKRNILYTGLKITGNYDYMQGLIMKPEVNPSCESFCHLLNNLYTEAVTIATSLIQQYRNVLTRNSELPSRFDMTFGAGNDWKSLFI